MRAAAAALETRDWALVGGLAVSARCEPRFTRDVDLAVAVADDAEAEALVRQLLTSGYQVLATVEQEAKGRLATVRLAIPGEAPSGVVLDLLFASSGIEGEIAASADRLEVFSGLRVPVAAVGDLIALKLLSRDARRPQDAGDLQALVAQATTTDRARAKECVRLITSRSFARGRDLERDLEVLFTTGV